MLRWTPWAKAERSFWGLATSNEAAGGQEMPHRGMARRIGDLALGAKKLHLLLTSRQASRGRWKGLLSDYAGGWSSCLRL